MDSDVRIVHATGVDGAAHAVGVVVVIDVLRAFTVSAYALAGGARECRLVTTTDGARALAASEPGSVLCAEENTMPVPGVAISNSPTAIRETDLEGRVLVQRSSAGTQVVAAVHDDAMYAGSLVVATATVRACLSRRPGAITLIASGDFPEDHACARYMEMIARGRSVRHEELDEWLEPLRRSERWRRVREGTWPGFPKTDLDLALSPDVFDFAMPVRRAAGYHRLTREDRNPVRG